MAPLDLLTVAALLWIAWGTLVTRDLFSAVVLFIVFGLLMALAWVRLGAPDVALAEAAIGAGLTGVLLLDTAAHLEVRRRDVRRHATSRFLRASAALLAAGTAAALVVVVVGVSPPGPALARAVAEALPASGVDHEVTAVLLNFRGYDTLLEIAVLLVAALGVLAVRGTRAPAPDLAPPGPVLAGLTGAVAPLALLVAGFLLWAGSHRPGGAFQAGAVLAAAAVLLRLTGALPAVSEAGTWLRLGLAFGFSVFLAVAGASLPQALLAYPPDHAGSLIVAIEAALTLSIAVVLYTVFAAAPPERRAQAVA